MKKSRSLVALTLALCIVALALPAAAQGPRFLTAEKSNADPLDIAMSYIRGIDKARLADSDLADLAVVDRYVSKHNGTTHIYLRQTLDGLAVVGSETNINIAADGRVINLGDRLVRGLQAAAKTRTPKLSATDAIYAAAENLGLEVAGKLKQVDKASGPERLSIFSGSGFSLQPIPVKLVYYAHADGSLRLAWDMVVQTADQKHHWNLFVDAVTGEELAKVDWMAWDQYEVFALPKDSPLGGPRTIEVNPADTTASPFGWHDTDGIAGAEFTTTRGNNVCAQQDRDGNNSACGTVAQPNAGASLDFTGAVVPLGLATQQPVDYQDAAVVNLFYWNNIMHDLLYQYGFDEASGNFQENNYGNGGLGSDSVNADAQDGADLVPPNTDNANFSTPPEPNGPFSTNPRMQMFEWTYPFSQQVTVNSPSSIAGPYVANPSNDGGTGMGLSADLAIVDDGVAPTDDGCETVTDLTGKIGLILWNQGACNSSVFVANAAAAGAVAVIIVDNTVEPRTNFGGSPSIPSVAVGLTDGQLFIDTINGGGTVNATLEDSTDGTPDRDSDLDAGIIAHEYGHGLSIRLTGGPSNSGCLSGDQQAGEGWSDLMTLFFTADAADTGPTPRGVGNYVIFEEAGGPGIRDFPYSTDLAVNPQTYGFIVNADQAGGPSIPHGVGTVWAGAVWEVYWNLVTDQGFDTDLYNGLGGNNLAIQLVVDGLKLQPCNPTFLDARDAILLADQNNTGGANECLIWSGFAKRGMGFSADDGGSSSSLNVTEAFDLPPQCQEPGCGDGICAGLPDEDCNSCPQDCIGGTTEPCGNGACEPTLGEDCLSCPADCNGRTGGKPANRFCCGDGDGQNPIVCTDGDGTACNDAPFSCTSTPLPGGSFCCGDSVCEGDESCSNCAIDCNLGVELCDSGVDEDCDGLVDCEDTQDCETFPACQQVNCSDFTSKQTCNAQATCRWDNKNKVCVAQ